MRLPFAIATLTGSASIAVLLDLGFVLVSVLMGLGAAIVGLVLNRLARSQLAISRAAFSAAIAAWPTGLALALDPPFLLAVLCQMYLFYAVLAQVKFMGQSVLTPNQRELARQIRAATGLILIVEYGERIGTYKGKEIPAFIRSTTGEIFYFTGIAPTHEAWRPTPGQTVVSPGLLFESSQPIE